MSLPRNPIRSNVPPYRPPGDARAKAAPSPRPVPTSASRPRSAGHACGLLVRIDGSLYELTLAPHDPMSLALRVWTMAKIDGDRARYQVTELPWSEGRHACECADWHYRHEGEGDGGCKHIRALRTLVDRGILAPLSLTLATDGLTWEDYADLNSGWTIAPTAEDRDLLPGELAVYRGEGGGR